MLHKAGWGRQVPKGHGLGLAVGASAEHRRKLVSGAEFKCSGRDAAVLLRFHASLSCELRTGVMQRGNLG
jgi:hypothetical protein